VNARLAGCGVALVFACAALTGSTQAEAYLNWTSKQVESIGTQAYQRGRVGGLWDTRVLKTERAHNYKLAATWLSPDVIRATARHIQLRSRLQDVETRALVAEAESLRGTVIIVEIDPREGSGVIPSDWEAFLQPKGRSDAAVRGTAHSELREVRALAGVLRRNFDYDRFWMTFPLTSGGGMPLFAPGDERAELVVRIHDKEGHVEWPIPASITRQGDGAARGR
jgi:hypothetical protein